MKRSAIAAMIAIPAIVTASTPVPPVPGMGTIGIVSISSIIPADQLDAGTNMLLSAGYRVKVASNVPGPKVAPPEERARILEECWLDPEIDMLLFSRGGEGAEEVVSLLDWERLRTRPDMPVVGFSDVTILLGAMLAKGVGHPISGPMLSYAKRLTPEARDWFRTVMAGVFNGPPGGRSNGGEDGPPGGRPLPVVKLQPLNGGNAADLKPVGPLNGGEAANLTPEGQFTGGEAANLTPEGQFHLVDAAPDGKRTTARPMGGHVTRLFWLWEHGLAPAASNRVVFLECTARHKAGIVIGELTAMRKGGFFDGAAAVVLCDFRHEGAERAALDAFFPDFAASLPCPVFAGFPYGHIPGILAIDFRREVSISADGALRF